MESRAARRHPRTCAVRAGRTFASIFRDAIGVLDTIGWLPTEDTAPIEVAITAGHIAQLQRLRGDLARAILDQLDDRATLTDPDEIA